MKPWVLMIGALGGGLYAASALAAEPDALLASATAEAAAGESAAAGPGPGASARTASTAAALGGGAAAQPAAVAGVAAVPSTGAPASAGSAAAAGGAKADEKTNKASTALRALADPSIGSTRDYYLSASISYRQPFFLDDDPANDIAMSYRLSGGYNLFKGGSVFAGIGLSQRFETNVPSNDSPAAAEFGTDGFNRKQFTFQDLSLGFNYTWSLPWAALDLGEGNLDLTHRLSVALPTSYASQQETLRVAPSLVTQGRISLSEELTLTLDVDFQYRFVRLGELPSGVPATQLSFGLGAGLEYTLAQSERFGVFALGADFSWGWVNKYPPAELSRPLPVTGATLSEGLQEDLSSLRSRYAWSAYAFYAPLPKLFVTVAIGTGGYTMRDGQPNIRIFDQEDTELSVSLSGRY